MISDAAVEAAASTLHPTWRDHATHEQWQEIMREALLAAAPHIAESALKDAAHSWREYLPAVAGYGKVQPVPVWLERRAEWVSRG